MYLISHTDCAQESNETRRKKFHQLVDFKQLASTKQIHLHTSWFTTRKAMLNLIPLDDSHHLSYVLIKTSKKNQTVNKYKALSTIFFHQAFSANKNLSWFRWGMSVLYLLQSFDCIVLSSWSDQWSPEQLPPFRFNLP